MANPATTVDQNLLPVQAYFNLDGSFNTFIGQNMPFYASINPVQSGLTITSSTIDSTTIGATSPSTGVFTNVSATTGQISTTPSSNTDIANKFYVDTVAQGLGPKAACQVATTTNITLSGLQTIDGYTTLAGDRVLVKNQSSSQYNGIYLASASTWTRSTDMDVWSEVPGAYTVILNGGQADTGWVCTATQSGTINVTAMPWVQFSGANTYFAGTGLSLLSNTFSITNTGVSASTYGSASAVPVIAVNAQGQITSATTTSIAISNTQVSGLGTMSTQNANSVAITGGSINGTTIGASSASTIIGTTITANSSFSGAGTGLTGTASGLSIGGNAATATTATTASSVTNSITFNSSGTGGASPVSYNGSTAPTISYNTIGAPSTSGTGASGTWGISISGNAATVTNGVYTTSSYSNPSWITSILGSIVSGAVASATSATNLSGGLAGSLPYQSGAGATTFLGIGSANYVLTSTGSAPQYVAQSTLSVGSASTATTATNLAGGIASQIPYQTAAGTTAFIANGTTGQFLQSNGTGAPTWATPVSYATVTDDTTTNGTRYPLFANQTSGNLTTEYTSSTKLQYNPNTGVFTSTSFSGAGTGLTGTASSLSIGGNAATATSATSATTATNIASGSANQIPYQTGSSTTSFITAPTTASTALTWNGSAFVWSASSGGVTISDDTSSATAYYPLFARVTSGTTNTEYTSSTKLTYTPSTGALAASSFSGAGTGLTGTASSLSIGGNAATATSTTTATTATNATNTAITDDTTTNATMYPTWVTTTTGNLPQKTSSTKLTFNPSTGTLTTTALNGSLGATTPNSASVTTLTVGGTQNQQLGQGNASIMKNRIINGAMVISQKNGTTAVNISPNQYTLDRWNATGSQTSKYSVQQSSTAPTGFTNSLLVTSLSAYSVLTGDFNMVYQKIEGYNVADLGWGTANAKTVTLSFQVYSSLTGTFGGSITNGAQNRSYPFTYTVSSANTWTSISVTIAGDTTGTWTTDNSASVSVFFGLGIGATYSGTAGAWASSTYYSATGATSVVGTSGATFYITGVQLEVGSSATGFEYRLYNQELSACQRYFVTATMAVNTVAAIGNWYWNMRASPTVTGGGTGFAVNSSNAYCGGLYQTAQGTQTLLASAEL